MNTPIQLVRSKYRALGGGCVSCSRDLAPVEALPGVQKVDALASGVVLVTHDEGAVDALEPERILLLPDGVEDLWGADYRDLISLA